MIVVGYTHILPVDTALRYMLIIVGHLNSATSYRLALIVPPVLWGIHHWFACIMIDTGIS